MLAFCLTPLLFAISVHGWGYIPGGNGPATWPDPACQSGDFQSPIDIPKNITYVDTSQWLPFQFTHYEKPPRKMEVSNNGHSAVVTFEVEGCNDKLPKLSQGNLPATYELAQFHFHWGWYGDHKGSEHTIHGKQYPAELHLVHYNTKCGRDFNQAIDECDDDDDALAVLGVMIEIGTENPALEKIVRELHEIKNKDDSERVHSFSLMDLLPEKTTEFWRYKGSLTTPGAIGGADCAEIVIWTVFKHTIEMSERQLEKFFKLEDEDGNKLRHTFRPPQPLSGRDVYFADLDFKCDYDEAFNWKEDEPCSIETKETKEEYDFNNAVHACTADFHHSAIAMATGLIPVGKLRCLRNKYDYSPSAERDLDDHFCSRFFRVNGRKDNMGIWREYPSGRRIFFDHFPEFQPLHGGEGDTLIWDALENRLFIDDQRDKYHAVCYKAFQSTCNCEYEFEFERPCTDSGDCVSGTCECDDGFSGDDCQFAPIPPYDIVQIDSDNDEVSDTVSGKSCYLAALYSESYGPQKNNPVIQRCTFVFGTAVCCSGEMTSKVLTDTCAIYDCFDHKWKTIEDLPSMFRSHMEFGSTVIREKGRDVGWLISGGEYFSTHYYPLYPRQLAWLDEKFRWTVLNTVMPRHRVEHCTIQINECEVAFIAGENEEDDDLTYDTIDIYNFKENSWRYGPNSTTHDFSIDYNTHCGRIIDKKTGHTKVVMWEEWYGIYEWDIQENTVTEVNEADDDDLQTQLYNLNDNILVNLQNDEDHIYIYEAGVGLKEYLETDTGHEDGGAIVAPRNQFKCAS